MSALSDREVRHSFIQAEDGRRLRGTAIVFDSLSRDLGGFREIIAPSAVERSLKQAAEIHAFYNHNSDMVLGNTRAGTLVLRADRNGLNVEITPPTWAANILESVQRGDVRGMSFAFRTRDNDPDWVEWDWDQDIPVRTVKDMEFSEVSIVAKPAYTQTDIAVALRSMEQFRASGMSIDMAMKLHWTNLLG